MQRKIVFLFAALLIISSCKLKEDDSGIVDPTESTSLKVVAPNGGESLMEGSAFEIKWTATTTSKLRIHYSYDNGATWFLIADSLTNTGLYSWFPVPNTISNQCKIRIATLDNVGSDLSDQVFSIIKNSNESLRITSPLGNEGWEAGSAKQITWFSSGLDSVRIEYTTNNGNTWNLIAIDKRNTGIYFWEPVPNTPSTLAKVRIKDAKDGVPSTESPNTFSILPEPAIKIVSPNGSESIDVGSSFRIEWISENIQSVDIAYTTDNGYSWKTIVNSTPSVGYYYWNPVPAENSQLCKIRISDSKDGEPKDFSDNTFTIKSSANQTITLKTPNGNENWEAGSAKQITWYNSSGIDSVALEYTTDNGNRWNKIGVDKRNTGIYYWEPIPNTPSTLAKVRVKDAKDGVPSDESDNTFNILPEPNIRVLTPNGGEKWQSGSNKTIEWVSENIENVKIEYTTNNGQQWFPIVASTPSVGFYYWQNIPNHNSNLCKVRVMDAHDNKPDDVSDNVFTITNQLNKSIDVVSPAGGEEWQAGTSENIVWTSVGVSNVKIEFTSNNGLTWNLIQSNFANTGSYNWSVPNISSSQCKIKVSDATDNTINAESKNTFTINPIQSLTLIAPNGNETIIAGESYTIQWTATGIKNVKIEFTPNNGILERDWFVIVASTPAAAGSYSTSFTIPSNQYRVRISDAEDGSPMKASASTFVVTAKPSIQVLSPNGNEIIDIGSSFRIEWISENVQNVSIAYTTDNGFSWHVITNSTPSVGYYYWSPIPDVNSQLCKIRIANAVTGEPKDYSDNAFTIKASVNQTITLKIPNGNENWEAGSAKQITWYSSSGIDSVYLEYTTDNGNRWNYLGKDTKNTGIFFWEPIPNTPSTLAKVRIKDAKDGIPSDESDATFNILPEPNIRVITPNGGERWQSGSNQILEWVSENVANVKIEYTTNNGQMWFTIVSSTPSVGFYYWQNIPSHNSNLCKVRVSDALDNQPIDASDNVFTITNQLNKSISVLAPFGGEEWQAGTTENITWTSVGISHVKIEFTSNNGLTWNTIENNYANTGSYPWNIPNISSTQCKVKISDASDLSINAQSNNTFTVIPIQSITLIAPNGNENIIAGESYTILWSSTGIKNVKIDFTPNNGILESDWHTIVASTPAAAGSYSTSFTIPSNQYRVRISDADDGSPMVASASTFTVGPKPSITVLTPNGGENWLIGQPYEIRWQSNNVSFVKIELTSNGGASWKEIVNNIPSNGIYNWTVNYMFVDYASDLCKIKISEYDPANPSSSRAFDESDNYFSIHPKTKLLRVQTPNGGESWSYTTYNRIEWISSGITSVKLEYTIDNGVTWYTISDKYPSTGAYDWNPPNIASSLARIRITDVSDDAGIFPLIDVSDNYFNLIQGAAFITIVKPDDKSVLTVGTPFIIRWNNSDEITSVTVEFSLDNGNTWNLIATVDTPEKIQHQQIWTPAAASNTARIRISGGGVIATSSVFIIQ